MDALREGGLWGFGCHRFRVTHRADGIARSPGLSRQPKESLGVICLGSHSNRDTRITSFHPHSSPGHGFHNYPHFIDEEIEAQWSQGAWSYSAWLTRPRLQGLLLQLWALLPLHPCARHTVGT